MDVLDDEDDRGALYTIVLYAVLSFIFVLLAILIGYVMCTKKYRLNWFEKNLLENADTNKDITHSQEALVGMHESTPGSSKILYPLPPDNGKFWVPQNLHRQNSLCTDNDSSPDNSIPASPTSSSSYQPSPFSGPVAVARNDKQIVLTSSPVRPRVSSMQSKLDHTKIDSSLYQTESPGEPEDIRGSIHISLTYDAIAGILAVRLIEFNHKHIEFEQHQLKQRCINNVQTFQRSTIQLLLTDVTRKIKQLTRTVTVKENELLEIPERQLIQEYLGKFAQKIQRKNNEVKETQRQKIESLQNKQLGTTASVNNKEWITNLSETELPDEITHILSLGPSFSIEYQRKQLPTNNIIANIEGGIQHLNTDQKSEIATKAQDLQARDFSGTADPYAKIRLLPDKTNVWQTRIHKKTLNPVFDEDFVFEVRAATTGRHTLEVLLYDFDAYSRHHSIGGVQLPLSNVDLSEKVDMWKSLTPCTGQDPKVDLGELMVSLAYLPSAERLTVVVIKARNLRIVDDTRNSSDPYVKVALFQGSKRMKKRKTGVHRNTICPVFNEALTFDIDKESLRKSQLEFCVMHDSLLGASEQLGVCRVGRTKECRPEEKSFFADMLHSKTATAQWLTLADPRTPP